MTAREKGKTHLEDELLLEDEDELDEDELHVTATHLNIRVRLLSILHLLSDHLPLSPAK